MCIRDSVTSLARLGRLVVIGLQGGIKGELNLNKLLSKAGTVTATSLRFRPTAEKAAVSYTHLDVYKRQRQWRLR